MAKTRRGDILLEVGDTQQLVRQHREAADTYQQILNENGSPDRLEEALQRLATARHLAGQYQESDDACRKFFNAYPNSPLLPAVLLRHAENAYLPAVAAANNPNLGNREAELQRLFGEAAKRYQAVVDKYPEYADAPIARQGMAMCEYGIGHFAAAGELLAAIADSDRGGLLAAVPYVQADCLLRTLPGDVSDARSAARMLQQVVDAQHLLEGFLAAQPTHPQAADALLKLGHCHQQIAAIVVEPAERTAALNAALQIYAKLFLQFGNHPLMPMAVFERAICNQQLGDLNSAGNECSASRTIRSRRRPLRRWRWCGWAWCSASSAVRRTPSMC